jgi:hypothetical protein
MLEEDRQTCSLFSSELFSESVEPKRQTALLCVFLHFLVLLRLFLDRAIIEVQAAQIGILTKNCCMYSSVARADQSPGKIFAVRSWSDYKVELAKPQKFLAILLRKKAIAGFINAFLLMTEGQV